MSEDNGVYVAGRMHFSEVSDARLFNTAGSLHVTPEQHGDGYSQSRTTAQLSSAERSKVNDALIAQVGALTKQVNELTAAVSELRAKTSGIGYDVATDTWVLDSCRMRAKWQEEAINGLATFDREQDRRIDAIERGAAVLSAWVRRPWWERVKARLASSFSAALMRLIRH